MYGPVAVRFLDLTLLVDRVAEHVQEASEDLVADGYRDRLPSVPGLQAAAHAVRRAHRDRTDHVVADDLLDLQRYLVGLALLGLELDFEGVEDLGDLLLVKADVHHDALDLDNLPDATPCPFPGLHLGSGLLLAVDLPIPLVAAGASVLSSLVRLLLGRDAKVIPFFLAHRKVLLTVSSRRGLRPPRLSL